MRPNLIAFVLVLGFAAASAACAASPGYVAAQGSAASASREIRLGETVRSELRGTSPRLDDDSHFELWRFQGRAGQRVTVNLRSDDFDAFLGIERVTPDGAERLQSDDDGGDGTDSRIHLTLPADGVYQIVANTLGPNAVGWYTLSLEAGDPNAALSFGDLAARAAQLPAVTIGTSITGRLTASSASMTDGSFADAYTFRGSAGETVEIEMSSDDFDAYLHVGEAGGSEALQTDDDGAGGTDSRVVLRLPRTGSYVIVANSLSAGETGSYRLRVLRRQ